MLLPLPALPALPDGGGQVMMGTRLDYKDGLTADPVCTSVPRLDRHNGSRSLFGIPISAKAWACARLEGSPMLTVPDQNSTLNSIVTSTSLGSRRPHRN